MEEQNLTYIKNTVIYGVPGMSKSFFSKHLVLYALSLGLNVISKDLMGVQANSLGRRHLDKIFKLPTSKSSVNSVFQGVQSVLDKVIYDPLLLLTLQTLDVIFLMSVVKFQLSIYQ